MADAIEAGKSSSRSYTKVTKPTPEEQRIIQFQREDKEAEKRAAQKAMAEYQQRKLDAQQQMAPTVAPTTANTMGQTFKKGGVVKSSASKRGDGCAQRGKTRGRIV